MNPKVHFVGTATTTAEAVEMVRNGAYGCVCPPDDAAASYVNFLQGSLTVAGVPKNS